MKQFFEQYGGIALGILALIVLIAMITPVGNIIKTSLQDTVQTFSTRIEEQQTDTIDIDMGRFSNELKPVNLIKKGVGGFFDTSFGTWSYDEESDTYTMNKIKYSDSWADAYGLYLGGYSFKQNDVYLVVFDFKSTVANNVFWEFPGYMYFTTEQVTMGSYDNVGTWGRYSFLLKAPQTTSGALILKQRNVQAVETRQYKNVQLYNLTDLYGAGNEPTTKEQAMEELYL